MDSPTLTNRAELGSGLIDAQARKCLEDFSSRIADNHVDANDPEASQAYREYVAETVQTQLTDILNDLWVEPAADWEAEEELAARSDALSTRDLG